MTYRLVGILWMMGCLCTPAVAAIRLVPAPGGGFHMVFTTPPSVHLSPVTEVRPHPAWLKPSYLLGTWKIVGKWGMTGGEVSRSWHKLEEEQIGRTVVFTKTNVHYKPPFLAYGIGIDCAAPPRYTVKVATLPGNSPESPGDLNYHGMLMPPDYWPPNWNERINLKAECAWRGHPHMPLFFTFQLTRTGELASASDMGFFLLKKMKPQ